MPFLSKKRNEKYRNTNGVHMKLSNFLVNDPTYSGKGLEAVNKLEKELWNKYAKNQFELHKTAQAICDAILKPHNEEIETTSELEVVDTAPEGKVLTRIHSFRERKQANVEKKKANTIKRKGNLKCEVCEFVFEDKYGELGKNYAECHHLIPLSELKIEQKTKLDDLAIVCANCHRMIHRKKPWLTIDQLKSLIRN